MDIRKAEKELEAAKALKDTIADLANGDTDVIRDTLEGEYDFEALIDKLLNSIGEDEAMLSALKLHIKNLEDRKERIGKRIESKRTMVQKALEISERDKIECPSATVSLIPVKPTLIIKNEEEIPSRFWKLQDPVLDKKAISEALKNGSVPGAVFSNGGATISIRVK